MKTAKELVDRAGQLLLIREHIPMEDANAVQLHDALASACMEEITEPWMSTEDRRRDKRQAYYLSAEYLMGRMVYNNLFAMGVLEDVRDLLAERDVDLAILEDIEDDAFGNGGLGRLAACFLDSAATHDVPLMGYGLRYRYGLFKQSFADDKQVEAPDDWARYGDPWSIRRLQDAVTVNMNGFSVLAVPYDMPIIGYGCKSVGTLRLWQCEALHDVDFDKFNNFEYDKSLLEKNRAEDITRFLYPNENRRSGKLLRLKQQYVLCSASLQDMLRTYELRHGDDYRFFSELHAVQLNDTHPVMSIPELIRLLMERGLSFDEGFEIAKATFSYTNHTVMQEALEKWDVSMMKAVCPDVLKIIRQIDQKFKAEMKERKAEVKPDRCLIMDGRIHMAQLAVYATHTTNGVAEIHSQILKDDVFHAWYELYPDRFQNKTNGITQRRWLGLCNPELTELISGRIGNGFLTELTELEKLKEQVDDDLIRSFQAVKRGKKEVLAARILKDTGYEVSPDMVFDVHIKRLHEYKRQLLNALSIVAIYHGLKKHTLKNFKPTCFIFGAKAFASYNRAKAILYFINRVARKVNSDPETRDLLKVVFMPNYNCSLAEVIIPAADISEQISPAGTEASGTGNMKLMLNGAVTLGTYDGANIEIVEEAGRENNYIFGATVDELNALRPTYDPKKIYKKNKVVKDALDSMISGEFGEDDPGIHELYTALLEGTDWHKPDHYFLLKDFDAYLAAKLQAIRDYYDDPKAFAKKCLMNIASAGTFSSDRTIRQYAREIWKLG